MLFKNKSNQPNIAITAASYGGRLSILAIKLAVRLAGGNPIVVSVSEPMEALNEMQGLILAGGSDVDPKLYGETGDGRLTYNFERDHLEQICASHALSRGIPILGICRGAQMLNIVGGGTLHQNLSDAYEGFLPTRSLVAKMFERRKIKFQRASTLSAIFSHERNMSVNSIHKQGIDQVAKGFRPVAVDRLGIIQAIETKDPLHFAVGVQWHPELMIYSRQQRSLFEAFVRACKNPNPMLNFEPSVSRT